MRALTKPNCKAWLKNPRALSDLNLYFQSKVKMPRMRMGEQQEIETVINEEAFVCSIPEE